MDFYSHNLKVAGSNPAPATNLSRQNYLSPWATGLKSAVNLRFRAVWLKDMARQESRQVPPFLLQRAVFL